MNIKTATAIAIGGVAISLLMSLCGQLLLSAMLNSDMSRERIGVIQTTYFMTQSVIHYGCLLVFFFALYARQKSQP
jgi:hypothetical protein